MSVRDLRGAACRPIADPRRGNFLDCLPQKTFFASSVAPLFVPKTKTNKAYSLVSTRHLSLRVKEGWFPGSEAAFDGGMNPPCRLRAPKRVQLGEGEFVGGYLRGQVWVPAGGKRPELRAQPSNEPSTPPKKPPMTGNFDAVLPPCTPGAVFLK
jgi:hypothetical protein